MPLCASIPATVDTETNTRVLFLNDLDDCMKNFNTALAATMNSYRSLLTAFDQVAQVYGNIAQQCSDEARVPVGEFREGMRNFKDKGGFETFNSEVHSGTIAVMEPVRRDLKKALKSYKALHSKQKEYDTVRYNLGKTEQSYAKKDKPLAKSSGYKKNLAKRDKCKTNYETSREAFAEEVAALHVTTKSVLLQSLNNYLHCTATFCGQIEATMNGYRTDADSYGVAGLQNTNMDRLKERAAAESTARQDQRKSVAASQAHAADHDAKPNQTNHGNGAAHNGPPAAAVDHGASPDDQQPHDDLRQLYGGGAPAKDNAYNPFVPGAVSD